MLGYLRSLDPKLPRSVYTLQAGGLVSAFGNGLVLPFAFIYLHNVRGMGLGVAGLIVATSAAVSMILGPAAGSFVDRLGARRMLATSLVVFAAGYGLLTLVHAPWQGFLAMAVVGVGHATFWPAQSTLITTLAPRDRRTSAFAMQRLVMNLGIGVGALVGGLIASTDRPGTFVLILLLDAATFLVYLLVLVAWVPEPEREGHARGAGGGYGPVLRNRPFVGLLVINTVFIFAGFSGFEVLPPYAKNEAGLTESAIGILFLVNTLVIVLAQLPVAKLVEGHRRMRVFALLGVVWAAAWLFVPIGGGLGTVGAMLLLALAMAVFAIGECLHGAVQAPLVADLADPRLLGRYMALSALSWQIGFALGPAAGGFGLALSPTGLWIAAAAVCLLNGLVALALEPRLPTRARRTPVAATT